MIALNKLHTDLHTFSLEIVAESVRNLDLLKNTEPTRSRLSRLTAQMTADSTFAGKTIVVIQNLNMPVDADGSISEKLQEAQNNTNKLCDELGFLCKSNEADREIAGDDNIEIAFTEAIVAADNLHDILGILRTMVINPVQTPQGFVSKFFVV